MQYIYIYIRDWLSATGGHLPKQWSIVSPLKFFSAESQEKTINLSHIVLKFISLILLRPHSDDTSII